MPPPMKPCSARQNDHLAHRRRQPAHQAREGEARGGAGEHDARAERARQKAGQRNGDHFGHQIRGLHPGDLVARCGKAGLDFRQRRRHHLDVEERHEHAEAHRQEGEEAQPGRRARRSSGREAGRAGRSRLLWRWSWLDASTRISERQRAAFCVAAALSATRGRFGVHAHDHRHAGAEQSLARDVEPARGCAPAAAARSW